MYYNLLKKYIDKLRKDDIINYSIKERINLTEKELNVIYNTIKSRWEDIYKDGISVIEEYKNILTNTTYVKLKELYNNIKKNYL